MSKDISIVDEMRAADDEAVVSRRHIAALATAGLADFSVISLFQLGYIKHLPDLPMDVFDSDSVNSSEDAVLLGVPDAPIALVGYAATVLLATAGNAKGKHTKFFDLALSGIVLGQAFGGAHYLYKMAVVQKKVCLYCVAGALLNFAVLKPLYGLFRSRR